MDKQNEKSKAKVDLQKSEQVYNSGVKKQKEMQIKLDNINKNKTDLESSISSLSQSINKLEITKIKKHKEYDCLCDERKTNKQSLQDLINQKNGTNIKIQETIKEKSRLEQNIMYKNEKKECLVMSERELNAKLRQERDYSRQIEIEQENIKDKTAVINTIASDIKQCRNKVNNKLRELVDKKSQTGDLKSKMFKLETETNKCENEMKYVEQTLSSTTQLIQTKENEKRKLVEEIRQLPEVEFDSLKKLDQIKEDIYLKENHLKNQTANRNNLLLERSQIDLDIQRAMRERYLVEESIQSKDLEIKHKKYIVDEKNILYEQQDTAYKLNENKLKNYKQAITILNEKGYDLNNLHDNYNPTSINHGEKEKHTEFDEEYNSVLDNDKIKHY